MIIKILQELDEAYKTKRALFIEHDQARDDAIPSEVEARLADIDAEFEPKLRAIEELIRTLEADAKAAVLASGHTAKAGAVTAVYSNGRVTWDGKKLDGMMALIPQLREARKEGEPTVTIRVGAGG